jgi:hypothetical protein
MSVSPLELADRRTACGRDCQLPFRTESLVNAMLYCRIRRLDTFDVLISQLVILEMQDIWLNIVFTSDCCEMLDILSSLWNDLRALHISVICCPFSFSRLSNCFCHSFQCKSVLSSSRKTDWSSSRRLSLHVTEWDWDNAILRMAA